MRNLRVEAEGEELVLKNSAGDHVIIPKKYRRKAQRMLERGCHDCIDRMVATLPTVADYAEDGSLYPNDDETTRSYYNTDKTGKINAGPYTGLTVEEARELNAAQHSDYNKSLQKAQDAKYLSNVQKGSAKAAKQIFTGMGATLAMPFVAASAGAAATVAPVAFANSMVGGTVGGMLTDHIVKGNSKYNSWGEMVSDKTGMNETLASLTDPGMIIGGTVGGIGAGVADAAITKTASKLKPNKILPKTEKRLLETSTSSNDYPISLERAPKRKIRAKRPAPDNVIGNIGDDIQITKDRWGDIWAKTKGKDEYVALKTWDDNGNLTYKLSANMPSSPLKAGKSMKELEKYIPIGGKFKENQSLSMDSFTAILNRIKHTDKWKANIEGDIPLNNSSKHIKTPNFKALSPDSNSQRALYHTRAEANKAAEELNVLLKQHGLPEAKVIHDESFGFTEGMRSPYGVNIPNISLTKLASIFGISLGTIGAGKNNLKKQ